MKALLATLLSAIRLASHEPTLGEMVKRAAAKHNLPAEVVAAVVWQESRGNPWAFRYEPGFYRRYLESSGPGDLLGYVPKGIPTFESELRARAISFGLMQVMGNTAREQGFDRRYLSEMFNPEVSLDIGCAYLRRQFDRYDNILDNDARMRRALEKYNGSPDYPRLIYGHIATKDYRDVIRL